MATSPAFAQSTEEILRGVRGVIDLLGQPQQGSGGSGVSRPDIGRSSGRDALVPPTPGVLPSKQSLLEAAKQGHLIEVRRASEADKAKVVDSVYAILVHEYQVPPIKESCRPVFRSNVENLLFESSYMWGKGLNSTPPEFFRGDPSDVEAFKKSVADVEYSWSRSNHLCDSQAMGRWVPHPYKGALMDLLNEYNAAHSAYVQQEVVRRKGVYAAEVARAQEAAAVQREQAARQEAAQRAAAQQRLDAENARIRADEQRRAEKERNRIGG